MDTIVGWVIIWCSLAALIGFPLAAAIGHHMNGGDQ